MREKSGGRSKGEKIGASMRIMRIDAAQQPQPRAVPNVLRGGTIHMGCGSHGDRCGSAVELCQGSLTLPLRTRSVLNLREHWAARARRTKAHRDVVHLLWPWKRRAWTFPLEVQLVRIYPPRGKELDDDNATASMKAVRDQVAAELGVDDGDRARLRFLPVLQEPGAAWGVRIEVRAPGR